MKLTSMCDFVLEQNKNIQWSDTDNLETIIHYAEFLKQPLELWMFVPCDENGNVLEDPQIFIDLRIEKYQQAKERCLFEGFEYSGETEYNWILKHNNHFPFFVIKSQKIEYLSNMIGHNITLTPTAIKQFE